MSPRATLADVAALAGVSTASASKALNDRSGLAPATRARILEAVARLGYTPTTTKTTGGTTTRVAVLFDTLANLYSLRMLDGLIAEGKSEGIEIVPDVIAPLAPGPGSPLEPERIRDLHRRGFAGALAVTTRIGGDVLALGSELGFPLVAVDPPNSLDAGVVSVASNGWMGAVQATSHLLGLGHRRIGFLGGDRVHAGLRERRAGYRSALESADIAEDPALVSEDGMAETGDAALRMLELPEPPTAFFASSDPGALIALRALVRAGHRVPDDISVIGFDDTYASLPAPVLLTTVHTPIEAIGRAALATLLRLAEGVPPVSSHVQLATSVVVRESTAPPKTTGRRN